MFWPKNSNALLQAIPEHKMLIQRLSQIEETDNVQPYETKAGDFGLVYRGLPLHDPNGAVAEAKKEVKANCQPVLGKVHLVLGLGLGYLLQEAFRYSPGRIVVYDPNPEVLKYTMENVDLSEYLESGRVWIVDSKEDLCELLSPMLINRNPLDVLSSPSYTALLQKEAPDLIKSISAVIKQRERDYHTGRYFQEIWIEQFFKNLHNIADVNPLDNLLGAYKGKPAIIISRGPSLDAAIPALKNLADSAVLIAVGAALHRLHAAGITPDFAVFLDACGMYEQLHGLPDEYLSNITFLLSPFTHPCIYEAKSRAKVHFITRADSAYLDWLAEAKLRPEEPTFLEGCGTVSIIGFQAALAMECNPVALVGQDLAFPNNQVYAGGIQVRLNEQGALDLQPTESLYAKPATMTEVDGQDGSKLPTLASYAGFIRQFEMLAILIANSIQPTELYNTSIGGANITGYTLRPLDSFEGEWSSFDKLATLKSRLAISTKEKNRRLEALQSALRQLKGMVNEVIGMFEANLANGTHLIDGPELQHFNNSKPFLANMLMYNIIDTRQQLNLYAETEEEHEANAKQLVEGTEKAISLLKDKVLPWVIQAESKTLEISRKQPKPLQMPSRAGRS